MSSKANPNQLSSNVITVNDVSKCYYSYEKPMQRLWHTLFPKKIMGKPFWALENVDMTIKAGETVGLVGKNGSGKSTVLQIITGILRPTLGKCETQGRISALLELGAGFNPEFTGIENARLNATIMGLSQQEFEKRLPDIIEFSGLDDFLYRPVKTYSSGMYVRLAFAVAINMEPDILIIDEALAVGDIRFQSKCFRRLEELKQSGVSILFVTHSTDSVLKYCDRAILLNEGKVLHTGTPKDVVQRYMEMMFDSDMSRENQFTLDVNVAKNGKTNPSKKDPLIDYCLAQPGYNSNEERWGDQRAKFFDYQVLVDGNPAVKCVPGQSLQIITDIVFESDLNDLIYGITIKAPDGNPIYGSNTRLLQQSLGSGKAGEQIQLCFFLDVNLLANDYFISLGIAQEHPEKDNIAIDRRYDMIHLRVDNVGAADAFGVAALNAKITTQKVTTQAVSKETSLER